MTFKTGAQLKRPEMNRHTISNARPKKMKLDLRC